MKTMNHQDARGPEETMHDQAPVVPAEPKCGGPAAGLRQAGVPDGAPSENPVKLARKEPGLCHPLAIGPARGTGQNAGTAAITRPTEPTSLGPRERPVWTARR